MDYNKAESDSKISIYFKKFKKLWHNRRYRAVFLLFLYFLFFLVMYVLLQMGSKMNYYEEKLSFSDYNNYEFTVELNINDEVYNINGKRNKDNYAFTIMDENFLLNYDEIMSNQSLNKDIINTFQYRPSFVSNIIDNAEKISETKLVSNGQLSTLYHLKLSKFLNILDVNLEDYNVDDEISIIINELDNEVKDFEIDLTNFYKYYDEVYQLYKIKIIYSNVNKIMEF